MDYTIYPYEGVGPIKFGMTPQQVHEILGEPYRTFKKSPKAVMPMDSYEEPRCQIFYKEPGTCNAIQLMNPSDPIFQELMFIGNPYGRFRDWFKKNDPLLDEDEDGLTSYGFGVGLYVPNYCGRNEQAIVEAVIVFERGYYNKLNGEEAKV
jgi:hypothetical protein